MSFFFTVENEHETLMLHLLLGYEMKMVWEGLFNSLGRPESEHSSKDRMFFIVLICTRDNTMQR